MSKTKSRMVIHPTAQPGYCDKHTDVKVVYNVTTYLPDRIVAAKSCPPCIEELKRTCKKYGVKIIDHRGAANN